MKWLCLFGFHKWEHRKRSHFNSHPYRRCLRCGIMQNWPY